ncbi:MAG: hypothetical protein JKY65_05200 [Planctomycetes bacterium]|nr:hypothetical protein [Planctomycetota bacterium]
MKDENPYTPPKAEVEGGSPQGKGGARKSLEYPLEVQFKIERVGKIDPDDEDLCLMGIVVMLLLERSRG